MILVLGIIALVSSTAWAYVPTVTNAGAGVRWGGDHRLNLAGNPSNRSGIDESSFYHAVVRGLQRWNVASGGAAQFDYWQGTDPKSFPPNSDFNGLSSIYFSSNSGTPLSQNVLGLTQVWYDTASGRILESDIVLNDVAYHFTTNPTDTSGYGSAHASGNNVFIENVVTHEIGHAFGLSHSGGLQSTMLFMESPEQAYLGCDEQIGIRALYPSAQDNQRGAIHGKVTGPGGATVFGAHILAVSRRRGTVLATGITDSAGNYTISALEPGNYFLIAEPYFAGAGALPSYYAKINPVICSGEAFGRTVLTDENPNRPHPVVVTSSGVVSVPPIAVSCGKNSGASVPIETAAGSFWSAPVLADASSRGFGAVSEMNSTGVVDYRLNHIGGKLEIHSLAYTLYSPIHTVVRLFDSNGSPVTTHVSETAFTGGSGYTNYDSSLTVDDLPSDNYVLEVSSSALVASVYPAGPLALDSVPFFMITGSVNEAGAPLASTLAPNARCKMSENFPDYSSPAGGPRRSAALIVPLKSDGTGFCGTISNDSEKAEFGAIAGWFLPWIFMVIILPMSRRWVLRVQRAPVTLVK